MAVAGSGNGWFHKPLDYDMCAAILDGKTGEKTEKFHSPRKIFSARTLVAALPETAESVNTNRN